MSKGNDSKKQNKKKPLKTLMEKRAAKGPRKKIRGFRFLLNDPILREGRR
jgi:hypothetical protein